jgi:hypothetical protein
MTTTDSPYIPAGTTGNTEVFCRLWVSSFLLCGLLLASAYNLVTISVERYLGIMRPLWHRVYFTQDKMTFSIVRIWVFGVSYMACVIAVPTRVADDECQVPDIGLHKEYGHKSRRSHYACPSYCRSAFTVYGLYIYIKGTNIHILFIVLLTATNL